MPLSLIALILGAALLAIGIRKEQKTITLIGLALMAAVVVLWGLLLLVGGTGA